MSLSSETMGDVHQPPPYSSVVQPPNGISALSLETPEDGPTVITEPEAVPRSRRFARYAKRLAIALTVLVVIAGAAILFFATKNRQTNMLFASRFGTVKLPLHDVIANQELSLSNSAAVTINGNLQLNSGMLLTPSLQPTGAKAGQIYYDQTTNQLAYFNGTTFVFLTGPQQTPGGVQSLGGATGQLTLGNGLSLTNTQLDNNGVLSVQGRNGNVSFTAGPGLVINGTTFSNSGVLSVTSGSPNVTVGDDGNGGVTISVDQPIAGTGTVTSAGGTAGTIPVFTADQNIEDSIITQSGLTVTISGDLSVITGGLSLSNALTVSNGGTGTNSLALNGVLVGQGTGPIGAVTSGAAGLCLLSTSGMPTWGVCPGGSGVTTLNGLSGALNVANASAAGSTITIDDASTTNKGIASFNGTNFNVSGGAVNTVQDINSSATPTFAGVNTNTITPNAALTVGISAQTALLQGSTTTITSNGVGNNIVLNSAGTIELQDTTNVTGNLNASGDLAVNGGDITSSAALNITPGGTLTVGVASQTLTLQGGASTSLRATSSGNTTVVGFTNPVANTTLNFPALAAGTYTICTTSGNCAGAATTLQGAYDNSSNPEIVLDATRGALTIRDNASPISGNLLEVQNNTGSATYLAVTSSGAAITGTATVSGNINSTSGGLQTGGTTRIDNSGNGVNLGSLTLSGGISGGTTITGSGNINTTGGGLQTNGTTRVDNSGNLINIAAVTASGNATFQGGSATLGTSSQAGTILLSDGSSSTGSLQVAALGQNTVYTLPDPGGPSATICLTTGNCAGTAGGVTTGGGTTNRLAKFNGTQTIADSSITDDGTNVSVAVDVIVQGGDLTVGSTSQPASIVLHDGNGQTTTLQAGDSAGNLNFILPTNTGVANQCLKQSGVGNQLVWQDCDGGSSGSSATLQTAYNNSTNPEITLNSSVGGLTIRDNSTPVGGNLFEIQNNLGSTTYLAVTATGTSANGSVTATGNINSSGGSLQTNGTTRIDNSGNAVNIGNITGSGAITVASVGAGNNITIDGANQFVVQDASVFNALTTFNANLDVGNHDIIGTTGNISLTNFSVAGATGNITAGTYNGQTISNAANFTGTVMAAGTVTTSGDLAVNGGDITSTGALNITPGGTLTVGATGQQLILQGSANTQLTATGSSFTTTVGFNGAPVGNVTYNFDRSIAAGTYTICTTIGNCAGSGGGVTTPGGTTGTIAVFTGSQTLGDSLLSQSGGTVTVGGNLNLSAGSQYRINGTQISSADLSNDANLAKLSASQTFTGNTVAFQNGTNSTNAFNVQNAGGNRIMTVSTGDGQVVLGQASTLSGQLVFMNVSNGNKVTIQPGSITADQTLTLPDVSGIICTDSGNCAGAGATLQTAYNFSVGGTTPKIKVNSTLGGLDIQDADTPIAANLLNIRSSNGAGLGSVIFGVGNTGQVSLQNSANSTAAFRLLTQGGTSVLTGDTTNGQILLGQSNTLDGTLVFRNASNANTITLTAPAATTARSITLPDASGVLCLSSGNCSGSGSSNTLQAAYDAGNTITSTSGRDVSFTMADSATDSNFLVNLQCTTGCGSNGRFAVQQAGTDVFSVAPVNGAALFRNTVNSTTAFQIQNAGGGMTVLGADTTNGRIGIGTNAPAYTLDVAGDVNTSTVYKIGGTTICTSSGCTVASGSSFYVQLQGSTPGTAQTGNFNITGKGIAGTLQATTVYAGTVDATTTGGTLAIGDGNSGTGAVNIAAGATTGTVTIGGSSQTGTINLGISTSSNTINIGSAIGSGNTQTINIGASGTTTSNTNVLLGSSGGSSSVTIQSGTGAITIGGGTAAHAVVIGNTQTGSQVSISCGGACSFGTDNTAHSTLLGSTNNGATTTVQAGGNVSLTTDNGLGGTTVKTTTNSVRAFQVQNATSDPIFVADTTTSTNLLKNTSFENASTTGWTGLGTGTVGSSFGSGYSGIYVGGMTTTAAAGSGIKTNGTAGFVSGTSPSNGTYTLSFFARLNSGTFTTLSAGYNQGASDVACTLNNTTVLTTGWQRYSCTFTASASVSYIYISQTDATARVMLIDSIQLQSGSTLTPYQIGGLQLNGLITTSATFQNATNSTTAFQIQNSAGTSNLFIADTINSRIGIGTSTPAYTLDVAGDINSSTALRVGGTQVCTSSGCTPNGSFVQLQGTTPGTPQTGNLNISGTAIAGTALQSPLVYANTVDTVSGTTTLNIGTTNATSGISLNQNVTLASGKTLTVQGTSSFKTGTDSTTALQVINSGNGKVFIVDTANNLVRVVTGTITNITTASGTGALQIGADNTDNLAFDDNEIMARNNGSASGLYLQKLGGSLNIQATTTTVKPNSNSTNAFQVQNAAGTTTALNVDTTNTRVGIGTGSPSTTFDVAVNNTQVTTPMALLEQAGTGDATIQFKNASASFYAGIDTSNANSFSINSSAAAANSSPGTISHVQSRAGTFSGSTTSGTVALGFSSNNTAGNTIVASITWDPTLSSSVSCSDSNGNSYTVAISAVDPGNQAVAVCYATNIIGGSNTVTATFGANVGYRMINIHEYSGVMSVSALDTSASNIQATGTTATDGYTSTASTTSNNGDLIYGALFNTGTSTTFSAGTGFTARTNTSGFVTEDLVQSTAASKAATWTGAAARTYIATMVALKASLTSGPITDTNTNALFTLDQNGAAKFKNSINSSTAFQIQNSAANQLFAVDTNNSRVIIGSGTTGSATPTLLVLNSGSSGSDPTGVAGAMYYNASLGKFRCYEGGAWKNCITSAADLARYRTDNTQTLSSGVNTKILFSQWDSLSSNVNISAGNDTFTLLKSGIWSITANLRFTTVAGASGERYAAIMDGAGSLTTGNRYAQTSTFPGGGTAGTVSVSTTRRFNANDTISILGYQTSGATATMDATWLGSNVSLTFLGD